MAMRRLPRSPRCFTSLALQPKSSPLAPRHLLSIADLTPAELATLVRRASFVKKDFRSGSIPVNLNTALAGRTIAMTFSKRSTRTRVSTEGAITALGGHPMFLGKDDIQLGVNESLYDTSIVISSMVSAWVARVGEHSEITEIAKHSTVPVINALSDTHHPLQALTDVLTLVEASHQGSGARESSSASLGLEHLKIAWVGDANNVLFDLAIAASKLNMSLAVATPKGYGIPASILKTIASSAPSSGQPTRLITTSVPEEAVRDADFIFTDTWISMGQESESSKRREDFKGFRVTAHLARRGGAKEGWQFMHCLPRHPEEVSDDVFYGSRSLVFPEAENRLWTAIAALEAFVVNKGSISPI